MINLGLQTPSKGPRVDTADMDGSSSDSLSQKPSTTKMGCTNSGASVLKSEWYGLYIHLECLRTL